MAGNVRKKRRRNVRGRCRVIWLWFTDVDDTRDYECCQVMRLLIVDHVRGVVVA